MFPILHVIIKVTPCVQKLNLLFIYLFIFYSSVAKVEKCFTEQMLAPQMS